jgi:hypothetical protein
MKRQASFPTPHSSSISHLVGGQIEAARCSVRPGEIERARCDPDHEADSALVTHHHSPFVHALNAGIRRVACAITLHSTTLHLHYATTLTLHTTLHYTTLYYTTLHYTTLHYTTLHYTTLNSLDYTTHNTTLPSVQPLAPSTPQFHSLRPVLVNVSPSSATGFDRRLKINVGRIKTLQKVVSGQRNGMK